MEIFAPDLFSDPIPKTSPAPAASAEVVRGLLGSHYEALGRFAFSVEQLGGAEINSKNFIATAGDRRVVVKCLEQSLEEASQVAAFGRWIHGAGGSVPEVMLSSTGAVAVTHAGRTWYVLEWVPGPHFSGTAGERQAVGLAIREMITLLANAPAVSRRLPVLGAAEIALGSEIEVRRDAWDALFGPPTAGLLQTHWEEIRALTGVIVDELEDAELETGVMHIDLHPHNVIGRPGGTPVFVDLDSFQICCPKVAVAFGCLKLLRQAVAASTDRDPVRLRELADEFVSATGVDAGAVGALARSEVVRRIFVLLRLSFEENDRSWNHVLPVHLRTLEESRVLFR